MSIDNCAPTKATAVANAFLDLQAADTDNFPAIDQMKIQKLTFYAHAWWLALRNQALFDEDIQAWPWGPVVSTVYSNFRECGKSPIGSKRATEMVQVGDGANFDFRVQQPEQPDLEVMDFLRHVWETHKQYTGIQLSNATHAPGEPWTIIKQKQDHLDQKPLIPNELIREVFKRKIAGQETHKT